MDVKEFEEKKSKLVVIERRVTEAETEIRIIEDRWKNEFKKDGLTEIEKYIQSLQVEIQSSENRLNELGNLIEGAIDWNSI